MKIDRNALLRLAETGSGRVGKTRGRNDSKKVGRDESFWQSTNSCLKNDVDSVVKLMSYYGTISLNRGNAGFRRGPANLATAS